MRARDGDNYKNEIVPSFLFGDFITEETSWIISELIDIIELNLVYNIQCRSQVLRGPVHH